jgi:hypothetical protein
VGWDRIFALATRVTAQHNVNVGSNINTAPAVVNDPDLDFGFILVSDYAHHRVVKCWSNTTCADFIQKGSGGLKNPMGLDFGHHDNGRGRNTGWDDSDKLYVASEGTKEIILYNAQDGVLKKSPFCRVPGTPRAVKYFQQSIYVAEYHKHRIVRYNARTGAPQGVFTSGGPTLFRPMDIEFDPFGQQGMGGNLYVASQNSIFQYERHSGAFINQWSKDLRLNSISGISFRRNDPTNHNIFVTGPYMGKVFVELKERNCTQAVGGTYCPDTTQATGEYVKRQYDEYLQNPFGIIAHPVPKKKGTMVTGPRHEVFVCSKDEIRRYDGNTGEFISVYAQMDGMDCTYMHFNQHDQPDCYGASCPVQTCVQCGNLNTVNANKQN